MNYDENDKSMIHTLSMKNDSLHFTLNIIANDRR